MEAVAEDAFAQVIRVEDLDLLVEAIRGARLFPCVLADRMAPSVIRRLVLRDACLDLTRIGPAMQFTGAMPDGCYALALVRACPGGGHSFNFGVDHVGGDLGVFAPGSSLDSVEPGGSAHAILTVEAERFRASVSALVPELADKMLHAGFAVRIGPADRSRLEDLLTSVEDSIDLAAHHGNAPLADPVVRSNLEDELIGAFFDAVRSALVSSEARPVLSDRRSLRGIESAREFIVSRIGDGVRVGDVAAASGLSERGLEKLFRRMVGTSPHAYQKRLRLCGANIDLAREDAQSGMVKRIALKWGFWHLGRFARDYEALFGETPSETLAGPARCG